MGIDAIVALGDDQMTNMFELVFPSGIPGASDSNAIALRMDASVEVPEDVCNIYEILYKGMKIPKVGTMDESTKELSFEVRLDQQWKVYDDLKRYKNMVYNSNTGTRIPHGMLRTTITINALDSADNIVKTISFKGALLKSIAVGAFDQTSGDPIKLTLGWVFTKMEDEV